MGQLRDKVIVQSRNWLDPNTIPIPPYDYDLTFPITVFEAVKRNMDDNSSNLVDELEAIYRLINGKQNIVEGGTPGNLMTWTGIRGNIGSLGVVKVIDPDPALRSHSNIPTERAIGNALDKKASVSDLNIHINNNSIHITDTERIRWNSMAPMSTLQAHISNSIMHVTNEERARWNAKANQSDLESHVYDTNNPHNVTPHQIGTYNRKEIDDLFEALRESFFNYLNIEWNEALYIANLVDYHPANWNPNYVMGFHDTLPDVPDPELTYFALKPNTDYEDNETNDVLIYVKRPSTLWQEVGIASLKAGDMVIRYPDTAMFVWVQGRFMRLFADSASGDTPLPGGHNCIGTWRPIMVDEDGLVDPDGKFVSWILSNDPVAPPITKIVGEDGYTPVKGIDYVDGIDGQGVIPGGIMNDLLVKLSDENYDMTWKSIQDILDDLVIAGWHLPDGIVLWDRIQGRPQWFKVPGDSHDGFMTQKATTDLFDALNTRIIEILERLDGDGGLEALGKDLFDHIHDFNNPHKTTPALIGAVSLAAFSDHVQNFNNPHHVTAAQLGLGDVDNTSDADKPISIATQIVLDELINQINKIMNDVDGMNFITNAEWNNVEGNLYFTFRDGTILTVSIPIKDIFNTIYFDEATKELVIILPDGTEHRIDINALIQTYYGSVGVHIHVIIENDNIIRADIIPSSIGELEIMPSVHLRQSPTTTTQPVGDKSTRIATTEFCKDIVINNLISYEVDRPLSANMGRILNQRKADIDEVINIIMELEGITVIDHLESTSATAALSANMGRYLDLIKAPRVHTSPSGATFGQATISLFGHARASEVDPLMDGTVWRGTDDGRYARADHRHPTDITRAPIHSPHFTGEPRTTHPPDDSNDDRIPTTWWVRRIINGVHFARCDTGSTTGAKEAYIENTYMATNAVNFTLQTGITIGISFKNEDTSIGATTLRIVGAVNPNGSATSAYPIWWKGEPVKPNMIGGISPYNTAQTTQMTHLFIFDGNPYKRDGSVNTPHWELINPAAWYDTEDRDDSNRLVTTSWVRKLITEGFYAECTTGGTTTAKTITTSSATDKLNKFIRKKGSMLCVKFTNVDTGNGTSTAAGTTRTLTITRPSNLESYGPDPIRLQGKNIVEPRIIGGQHGNHYCLLMWDGTAWELLNPSGIWIPSVDADDDRVPTTEWVRKLVSEGFYGTCQTPSATAAKVSANSTELTTFIQKKGSMICIRFDYRDGEHTGPTTLQVKGFSAGRVQVQGRDVDPYMIGGRYDNHYCLLMWDGANWQLLNPLGVWLVEDNANDERIPSTEWVRRNAVGVSWAKCTTVGTTATKQLLLMSDFMTNPFVLIQKGTTVVVHFDEADSSTSTTETKLQFITKDAGNGSVQTNAAGAIVQRADGSTPSNAAIKVEFENKAPTPHMIGKDMDHIFTFDGECWQLLNPNPYVLSVGVNKGTCTSSGSNTTKVVTLYSTYVPSNEIYFNRLIGSTVCVKFNTADESNGTRYLQITNINTLSSNALPIKYKGADLEKYMINTGHEHLFVFGNDNCWHLLNPASVLEVGGTATNIRILTNNGLPGFSSTAVMSEARIDLLNVQRLLHYNGTEILDTSGRLWTARYNDIAEWFEKPDIGAEDIEAGDILAMTEYGVVKADDILRHLVIGVFSDTFGHSFGGDKNATHPNDNYLKYAPIGLVGRVNVKVHGRVNVGDILVLSDTIPGVAMSKRIPEIGTIIGKALGNNNSNGINRIPMLIFNG